MAYTFAKDEQKFFKTGMNALLLSSYKIIRV